MHRAVAEQDVHPARMLARQLLAIFQGWASVDGTALVEDVVAADPESVDRLGIFPDHQRLRGTVKDLRQRDRLVEDHRASRRIVDIRRECQTPRPEHPAAVAVGVIEDAADISIPKADSRLGHLGLSLSFLVVKG